MWLMILKWICFILVCFDVMAYIINKSKEIKDAAGLIGILIGTAARVFVLYGTLTCWLLV